MKQNPRIVFIVPSLKSGGAERVIVTLANWLSREFRVQIWMMIDSSIEYTLSDNVYIDKRYTTIKKRGIKRVLWLVKQLKKDTNTVVISFMTKLSLYAIIAAKLTGTKIIVSERNDPSKTISSKYNRLRDFLYSLTDKIVFQTEGAKNYFSNKVQTNSVIILNPLRENVPNIYEGKREKKIVTISRLHPQKNINLLIEAFADFLKEYNNYQLVIYGDGPLYNELIAKTNKMGIKKEVLFAGVDENVLNKIKDAAMFAITSNFEGLSNALIEAMSIGLPCISTDSPPGGARMIINNGFNGILIPIGGKNELVEAMKKIASDNEFSKKIGKNAARLREIVDEENICTQWKKLILSL